METHEFDSKNNTIVLTCINESTHKTQQDEKKLEAVYPKDKAANDFIAWIKSNHQEMDFISWSAMVVANDAKCVNATTWHCSLTATNKANHENQTIDADVHSNNTIDNVQIK